LLAQNPHSIRQSHCKENEGEERQHVKITQTILLILGNKTRN
jgi:hypothetical protein